MNQLIEYQDQFVKYQGTYKQEHRLIQRQNQSYDDNESGTSYNAYQKESFAFSIKLKKQTLDTQIIQKQSTLITQIKADNLKLRSVLQKTYKELKSTQSQLTQLKSQMNQFNNGYISQVILQNSQLKISNQQMQSQLSQYKLKNTSDYISSLILENTQLKINYDNLMKEYDQHKNSILYSHKAQSYQDKKNNDSDEYISSLILQNTQLKTNLQNLSKQNYEKVNSNSNQSLIYQIQVLKGQIQKLKENQRQLLQDNFQLQTQIQQKAKEIWILESKIIEINQKQAHTIKQAYRKSNQSDSILIQSQEFFQPKYKQSKYTQTQVYESFQFREKILDKSMTPTKRKNHHMSPAADKQYNLQEYARQLNQKQQETAQLMKKLQELQTKDSKLQIRLKRKQKQLKNAAKTIKELKTLKLNKHDEVIDTHHQAHEAQIQTDNEESSYRKSDSLQDQISIVTYQKETQTKQVNIFSNEKQQSNSRKNKFHQQDSAKEQVNKLQLSKKISSSHFSKQKSAKNLKAQNQKLKKDNQNIKQKLKNKQGNYKRLAKQFNAYKKNSSKIQFQEITQTYYEVEIQTDIIAVKNQKGLRPILKTDEEIQIQDKIINLTEKVIVKEKEIELLIEKSEQKIREQIQKNQQIQVQKIELVKKVQIVQEQNFKLKAKVQQFKNIYEQNLQIKQKEKEALQYQLELSKAKSLEGLKNLQYQTYSESGSDLPHSDRQMIFPSQKDLKTPTAHYQRDYNFYAQNIQTCQAEVQTQELQEFEYDGSREQHRILVGSANLQQKQSFQQKQTKQLGGSVDLNDLQNQSSEVKQYVIEQSNSRPQSPQQIGEQNEITQPNKAKNQQQDQNKKGYEYDDYQVTSPINQQQFYSIEKGQDRFNQNQNQQDKPFNVETIEDLNEKISKLQQKNKQLEDQLNQLKKKKSQKHVAFKSQNQSLKQSQSQIKNKESDDDIKHQTEQQKQEKIIQTAKKVTFTQQEHKPSQIQAQIQISQQICQQKVENVDSQKNNQKQVQQQQKYKQNENANEKVQENDQQQQITVHVINKEQKKEEKIVKQSIDIDKNQKIEDEKLINIQNHQILEPVLKQVQLQILTEKCNKEQLKIEEVENVNQPLKESNKNIFQQQNKIQEVQKYKLLLQDKDKIIQKLENQIQLLQQALLTQRVNYQNITNSQQEFIQRFSMKQNRLDIDRQKLQLAVNSTDSKIIYSSKEQKQLVQIDGVNMLQSKTYQIGQTKLMKMSEQSQRNLRNTHESELISAIQANQQKQKQLQGEQKSNFELIKQQRLLQKKNNNQMLQSDIVFNIQQTKKVIINAKPQQQQKDEQLLIQQTQSKIEEKFYQQNKQQISQDNLKQVNLKNIIKDSNIDLIKQQEKQQSSPSCQHKNANHVIMLNRAKSTEEMIEQFQQQENQIKKTNLNSVQNGQISAQKYDIIDQICLENLPFIYVSCLDDNQNQKFDKKQNKDKDNDHQVQNTNEKLTKNQLISLSPRSMAFVSKNIDLSVNLLKENKTDYLDYDKINIQPFIVVQIPKPEQNLIELSTKNLTEQERKFLSQQQIKVDMNEKSNYQIVKNESKTDKNIQQKSLKMNIEQENKTLQNIMPISEPQTINIELKTSLFYIQQPIKSQPITINPFLFTTCELDSTQQKFLLKQLKQYEQMIKEQIMSQKSITIKQRLSQLMKQVKGCLQTIDIYESNEGIQIQMCNYIVEHLGYKCFESLLVKKSN